MSPREFVVTLLNTTIVFTAVIIGSESGGELEKEVAIGFKLRFSDVQTSFVVDVDA